MCLVRGRSLCCVANSRAPALSSKTRQWTVGESLLGIGAPHFSNSFTSSIKNITSQSAADGATHSASVALKAMVVCILLDHRIGQFAHMMTQPVQERQDCESVGSASLKPPAKSAST